MNIWNFILNNLKENKRVILLIVIENKGSSPGRLGFKMAVTNNNEIFGSIGGGIMEYQMAEFAKNLFKVGELKPFIKKQIHNTKAKEDQSGMICSGEQSILFYPIEPNTENITLLEKLVRCVTDNCKSVLSVMPGEIKLIDDKQIAGHVIGEVIDENRWGYHEKISYKNELYIIGAGHVGLALSRTMQQLGFYVTIFDNRQALNTLENNTFAHKKQIVDYTKIDKHIPEGQNVYVVIMTYKHVSDKNVLSKLLDKKCAYIGLMGSKSKVEKLFAGLIAKGHNSTDLEKVHSPIGISIKSETPEEIAISIAAEIIMVKNMKKD
ncbi:MAG: hypothetical protein B6I20_14090 [Bacteroidetes bacterium 4572_117]|nr:MAG: hypothetical protein B6I20_14090 [Bacteroidetes bacterium 4572_117]